MREIIGTVVVGWALVASACGGSSSKTRPGLSASAGANHAGAQTNGSSNAAAGTNPGHGGASGTAASSNGGAEQTSGGKLGGDAPNVHGGTNSDAGAADDGGTLGDSGRTNDGGAFNAGASNGGDGGDGGAGQDELEIECSCAAGEACLRVTVRRVSDESHMPWVVWPSQTDGVGNLRLSAVSDQYKIQDKTTVMGANFVPADAAYGAPLCVPAGSTHVRAYLDDNEDEVENAVTSSDYLDSCASGSAQCFRCFDMNVSAGAKADLTIYLAHTCD